MFQPFLGHHQVVLSLQSNVLHNQHIWWGTRSRLQWSGTWIHLIGWYQYLFYIIYGILITSRSQWPRGLRRSSATARLLRSWVRIPPGAWLFVCCECCVLSGSGLCDELITRPEESYRLWCVVVCDLETSRMRRPWPAMGRSSTKKKF